MSDKPTVTVLVPAHNEERDIGRCLEAIAAQDYDPERIEVIVVDGASTDGTATRAKAAIARLGLRNGRVIFNPFGTTPSNLNIGLGRATGEILCRVDARSLIPPQYVSRCVSLLTSRDDVAVVGGTQRAVPQSDGSLGVGIARALNNRWGMGFSRYRRGAESGPSDTVYLGSFRIPQLRAVGGWDERLGTNQDFDLNRRMSKYGTVWFDADLRVGYVPRPDLAALFRQYRRFGQWKVRYWRLSGDRPQRRQVLLISMPPAALATLLLSAGHPRLRGPVLATAAAAGVAIEVLGSTGPSTTSLRAHATSLFALGAVGAGWLTGLYTEALHPSDD